MTLVTRMSQFEQTKLSNDGVPSSGYGDLHSQFWNLRNFITLVMISTMVITVLSIIISSIILANISSNGIEYFRFQESMQTISQAMIVFSLRLLPIFIIFLSFFLILGYIIFYHLFEPVSQLVKTIQSWSLQERDGQILFRVPFEFGVIARAVQEIVSDYRNQINHLEEIIQEKTISLEWRTVQLLTASEVVSDVISTRNFHVLLDRTTNLFVDRLKYYHVGIFLIDTTREFAVLEAASGEIGAAMIEQGHRLRLGTSSNVGYVSSTGEARVVNESTKESMFIKNPLLPHAKSELALPLIVEGKIIGILDIYQDKENAFNQEELVILQSLADQLAFAIDNSRLHQQYSEIKRQLDKLNNQIGLNVWQTIMETSPIAGYEIDSAGLRSFGWEDNVNNQDESIKLPIYVRGEITAWLDIWPITGSLTSTEMDILSILADRIGQAIESARIFEETIKRATKEQKVNEFVTSLSGTLELDRLLQDAVREIGLLPNVSSAAIRIKDLKERNEKRS